MNIDLKASRTYYFLWIIKFCLCAGKEFHRNTSTYIDTIRIKLTDFVTRFVYILKKNG